MQIQRENQTQAKVTTAFSSIRHDAGDEVLGTSPVPTTQNQEGFDGIEQTFNPMTGSINQVPVIESQADEIVEKNVSSKQSKQESSIFRLESDPHTPYVNHQEPPKIVEKVPGSVEDMSYDPLVLVDEQQDRP